MDGGVCVYLPHVCFSLQSAVEWHLLRLRFGAGGAGFIRAGPTWGPDGVQQMTG